jgi:hypothetical protein
MTPADLYCFTLPWLAIVLWLAAVAGGPMRRTRSGCCARAASGHATAAPPSSVMNSRRFN